MSTVCDSCLVLFTLLHICRFFNTALIGRERRLERKSLHVLECYQQKFYLNAVVNCVYILPQTCNYLLLHNSYATVGGVDFCFSVPLMLGEYILLEVGRDQPFLRAFHMSLGVHCALYMYVWGCACM